MSPNSPKRWLRPGSRRWREHKAERGRPLTHIEILKTLYYERLKPPPWADLARKHGWMTLVEYCRLPYKWWVRVPSIYDRAYATTPFLGLIKKDRFFGGATKATR